MRVICESFFYLITNNYSPLQCFIDGGIYSIKVEKGYRVIAYRYFNCDGKPLCVWEGNVAEVNRRFKDAQSISVVKATPDNEVIATAFAASDYKSDVDDVYQQFFLGEFPNLAEFDMDKKIRSIQIKPGYVVVCHIDRYFGETNGGVYRAYTSSVKCVDDAVIDKFSSMIVCKSINDIARVPSVPLKVDPYVDIVSSNSLEIMWKAPNFDGYIPITQYEVWSSALGWNSEGISSRAGIFKWLFSGIKTNTTYQFKIRARNNKGYSPELNYTLTTGGKPSTPATLTAKDGAIGEVILNWTPPTNPNLGNPPPQAKLNYLVSYDEKEPLKTVNLSYTFKGLTPGKKYIFKVWANNMYGPSDKPKECEFTPIKTGALTCHLYHEGKITYREVNDFVTGKKIIEQRWFAGNCSLDVDGLNAEATAVENTTAFNAYGAKCHSSYNGMYYGCGTLFPGPHADTASIRGARGTLHWELYTEDDRKFPSGDSFTLKISWKEIKK